MVFGREPGHCVEHDASGVGGHVGPQAVDRAVTALEFLAHRGNAGCTELAAGIGVHKSTAFRVLSTLEEHELVEQTHDRGKYRLGIGLLRLANAVLSRLDIAQQGRDVCRRFAAEIGDTVNIAVLRAHFAVNVQQARGPSAVGAHNWVGELTPLHATSSGKVLLASTAAPARRMLLEDAGLAPFTDRTVTSIARLERQLAAVARDGYAVSTEEFEEGLNAVAAPIRDSTGEVVAALSVSGPVYRLTALRAREIAPDVVAAANAVSRRMGQVK